MPVRTDTLIRGLCRQLRLAAAQKLRVAGGMVAVGVVATMIFGIRPLLAPKLGDGAGLGFALLLSIAFQTMFAVT